MKTIADAPKIILIGPQKCGKTTIANFVCCNNDDSSKPDLSAKYLATAGCRILEFEVQGVMIELWDCSGDHCYESCWSAFLQGKNKNDTEEQKRKVDGVILVYDSNDPNQTDEIELWHKHFVKDNAISDYRCLIIANFFEDESHNVESARARVKVSSALRACSFHELNWSQPTKLRNAFHTFLSVILKES